MTKHWLRAAGWWASDYAYAGYGQVRGVFTRADAESLQSGDLAPVVVIPGIYESWRFLSPLVKRLHELGHPIYVVPTLRLNLRPVTEAAAVVSAQLARDDLSGVIIVAHSKGGLIGKHVMLDPAARERVTSMLAVATPFGGSAYARFMLAPSLRIFSPKNATIRALAAEEAVNSRIVSIYGTFDPHIPSGCELPGAKNVELETGGHFRILGHARIFSEFALLAQQEAIQKDRPPELPQAEGLTS